MHVYVCAVCCALGSAVANGTPRNVASRRGIEYNREHVNVTARELLRFTDRSSLRADVRYPAPIRGVNKLRMQIFWVDRAG